MYQIFNRDDGERTALLSAFVRLHSAGHFLQSPQWAQVKQRWDWRGILAYDGAGNVLGAVSALIRPLPLGFSLLYAPRGPVCERNDPSVMGELFEGLRALAKSCRALLLYIDPDEADENETFRAGMKAAGFTEQSSSSFGNIQPQYVFRLGLSGRGEEEIFAGFSSKTRYNIRLAGRRGVMVRQFCGDEEIPEEALTAFSDLMEVTGRRDRFTVRDKAYFKRLLSALGSGAVLFLAYLDGQPIAGTIGIYYGGKAWYLYGASSNQHRDAMPNYLLQWEMIRRALRQGCSVYDFRGVPGKVSKDHPLYGLYRFKKGFSGDYLKFTGLFTYKYKRLMSAVFLALLKIRRGRQGRRS